MIRSVDSGQAEVGVARGAERVGKRDVDLAAATDLHACDGFVEEAQGLASTRHERQRRARLPG